MIKQERKRNAAEANRTEWKAVPLRLELHIRLKIAATRANREMRELACELMEEALEKVESA